MFTKLKQKLELSPKYTITQTKEFTFPVYEIDLSNEVDCDQISESCKKFRQTYKHTGADYEGKQALKTWVSNYLNPESFSWPELDPLFESTNKRISKLWGSVTYQDWYTYCLDQYWIGVYERDDYAAFHTHGSSEFSTVFYVEVPKNSSPIVFENTSGNLEIPIKQGMLLIFPGNASHGVYKSQHEGQRIIISSNYIKKSLIENRVIPMKNQ